MTNPSEAYVRMIEQLPQRPPFRFVEQIDRYEAGQYLLASIRLQSVRGPMRCLPAFPEACVMEGLAQSAVLLVQLETGPLREGEVPILGSLFMRQSKAVAWHETLRYEVKPIRLLASQARIEATAYAAGEVVAEGELSLAKIQTLTKGG
ncbi:3-hydroxyacyl-ACP dehydratase FabZ family protein [Paenibacillus campinasensis]|uniref:Beta-hydroxyacyl-ACP dehydratase n=1 Tax=Paenibacillus campinasensis TaxID=66347 RepID=A0A268EYU7_9BACL|nr:hypothetical protein [Paenibacillus campinasensis]PAD78296.1 hypothetical protein CHH67_07140 [Paenibacillus campinasensis]